jgi:hypothetical protein
MKKRLRPQVLVSLIFLGGLAALAITEGMVEIATACVTLIGVLSMKIIDSE